MTAPCPACGHLPHIETAFYRDGWMIDPFGAVAFKGPVLRIRSTWANILYTLAKAPGFISIDALLNRISKSDDAKVVHVQVCTLRKWLKANGLPDPIQSDRGYSAPGYRWNPDIKPALRSDLRSSAPAVFTPVHGA